MKLFVLPLVLAAFQVVSMQLASAEPVQVTLVCTVTDAGDGDLAEMICRQAAEILGAEAGLLVDRAAHVPEASDRAWVEILASVTSQQALRATVAWQSEDGIRGTSTELEGGVDGATFNDGILHMLVTALLKQTPFL